MEIPKYKSNKHLSWDEICQDFPEVANQIAQENSWAQFERKPDFSEVDNKTMQWIPEKVRERQRRRTN
jgi:hypothetical protein